MQQSYAKVSGVAESVGIAELVEDALRMNSAALQRHEITLVRDFQVKATITVERHKVLQILVNLIRNAKYACGEAGRLDKQITLQIAERTGAIEVAVIDNGVGIPAENLTRIFGHGFTTRKDGHGFGLHSGALAAREIGGELGVRSDGPGRGATFTLRLPFTSNDSKT
jgi:signal transduction histidine kinase